MAPMAQMAPMAPLAPSPIQPIGGAMSPLGPLVDNNKKVPSFNTVDPFVERGRQQPLPT